jgi:PAS domain S-box-containing protein
MMTAGREETAQLPVELIASLQKAFGDFQVRSEGLRRAYDGMRADFKNVNLELDKKNIELRKSLAVQEEMRTYLTSILQSMDNGVIGIDTTGAVTHFNRAAADITGFDPESVLGKSYEELFRCGGSEPSLLAALRKGVSQKREEKVLWRKDGHPVPVSYQTAILRDQTGSCLGAVEIFSDISRIKALEGEMQQARTMAALGEMSATVAHEIRNPLGAMGMWAGLLERDLPPGDKRGKTLKKIIEGLSRLNKIVSNLLIYTRPIRAELRKMALEDSLSEIVDFVDIEIDRLGLKIDLVRDWAIPGRTFVLADPEKIEQVVMNLCLNAMQAMPDGGALTVGIESNPDKASGYVCFAVRDTGVGIPEADRPKIFDPFFTTRENGTGLGLAIVKKFVEFHAGFIDVQSEGTRGATFRIFLPKLKE